MTGSSRMPDAPWWHHSLYIRALQIADLNSKRDSDSQGLRFEQRHKFPEHGFRFLGVLEKCKGCIR